MVLNPPCPCPWPWAQVTLVVGDVCDATLGGLPPAGTVDLVSCFYCLTTIPCTHARVRTRLTHACAHAHAHAQVSCSYCLTMIPPWRAALAAMLRLLRPGGQLCLVDFTCRSDRPPSDLGQRLNAWWFANDGVHQSRTHTQIPQTPACTPRAAHH